MKETTTPSKTSLIPSRSTSDILANTSLRSTHSLLEHSHLAHQLQGILDAILPDHFGISGESHRATVGQIKNGTVTLFFENQALASQCRFILNQILPTLHNHYGLHAIRAFKIIAQSVSSEVEQPQRRLINRLSLTPHHADKLFETARNESDQALSEAIAQLALHASSALPREQS